MFFAKIILLIALSVGFSACASKAEMKYMVVKNTQQTQYDAKYKSAIDVTIVRGGEETNPFLISKIDNDEFKKALIASLMHTDLYKKGGEYSLKAEILDVEILPLFSMDKTVKMSVRYTLFDTKNRKRVFKKTITEQHTATMSDAFGPMTKIKIANEGAAKENIAALLKELEQ